MRTKYSLLNMFFSTISMITSSILSLLMTRVVLRHLGSDYNGLNGTITQFLSVLMLFESGFTLAALVKLYDPFGAQNDYEVNRILSKAQKTLRRIGICMLLFGGIGGGIYALFIRTAIDYFIVVLLFFVSIASTAFNFGYVYKFRLLLQVSQHEYLSYIVNIVQYLFQYCGMMLIVYFSKSIVLARGYYLLTNILAGFAIGRIVRKRFPRARFDLDCSGVEITGTKDLLISKFVGILYQSLALFYMSVFVGTLQASVYVVYNSIVSIINSFLNIATSAPQNALGQIINTEKQKLKYTMKEYEGTVMFMSVLLLSTTLALIVPFVRFYTMGVTDVAYIQPVLAIILVVISATQIIHIPSGRCIELSGSFKIVRNIQLVTFVALTVFSAIGIYIYDLIGLLLAQLITNLVLAGMEIGYAHIKIVEGSVKDFFQLLIPHILLAVVLSWCEFKILFSVQLNILTFAILGVAVFSINTVIILVFEYVFFREILDQVAGRLKKIWSR